MKLSRTQGKGAFSLLVVHKEPFAVEEDGFGNFRLFARVSFFNVFAELSYDITLYDNRELHAFRTIRLDPKNTDEWILYSQYGGIPIPRSASSLHIQKMVIEPIQMSGPKCTYPVSFFFPDLSAVVLGQTIRSFSGKYISPSSLRNRPSRESRIQALANLGVPISNTSSGVSVLPSISSSGASNLHQPTQLTSSFKHKKKLQLKHEAQLRLENQHQTEPDSPLVPSLLAPTNSSFPDQKERIVLRLSRSDLQRRKEKENKKKNKKKKHKHHNRHHNHNETVSQHQFIPEAWSSTGALASNAVHTPSNFPTTSLAPLEIARERGQRRSSSSSSDEDEISRSLLSPADPSITKISSDMAHQRNSVIPVESAEFGSSPQLDPQLATMVWISQLNGGPQPLVSPLPPHASPLLSQTSPLPQSSPLRQGRPGHSSKKERHKEGKRRHRSKEKKTSENIPPVSPPLSTRQNTYNPPPVKELKRRSDHNNDDTGVTRKIIREEDQGRKGKENVWRSHLQDQSPLTRSTIPSDSTPPMSVEDAAPNHPTTAPPETADTNCDVYIDNDELERLYDRLLCLQNECMALQMAEVLRRYFKPGEDCGVDVLSPSDSLPNYPQVIAFDLRKMPLACILEMAEVISADERMSAERRVGNDTHRSSGDGESYSNYGAS